MSKYFMTNGVGQNPESTGYISSDRNSWIWGFVLSLIAMFIPILFMFMLGNDTAKGIRILIGSCDIPLLCMSTSLSLLLSDEWRKQKFIRNVLMLYLVIVAMIYAFSAYTEYADVAKNEYAVKIVNVAVSVSMIVIIVAGYIYHKN